MNLGEFLKPTKSKIILTLLIPYIYLALVMLYSFITGAAIIFPFYSPFLLILVIFGALVESFVSYPFASGLITLWNHYRKKRLGELKSDRKTLTMLILSILIFNPVTIRLLFILFAILLFFSFMR